MDSTRGIGGVIGAIVWILVNDVIGGLAGLFVGWMAVSCVEPILGGFSECVLLVTVPLGLCAGGLIGAVSLGWMAALHLAESQPALSHS
jgi:hypothetical protein